MDNENKTFEVRSYEKQELTERSNKFVRGTGKRKRKKNRKNIEKNFWLLKR